VFGLSARRSSDEALLFHRPHFHATEIATLTEKLFSPHHGIGIARTFGILNASNLIVRANEAPSILNHSSPPHAWFKSWLILGLRCWWPSMKPVPLRPKT